MDTPTKPVDEKVCPYCGHKLTSLRDCFSMYCEDCGKTWRKHPLLNQWWHAEHLPDSVMVSLIKAKKAIDKKAGKVDITRVELVDGLREDLSHFADMIEVTLKTENTPLEAYYSFWDYIMSYSADKLKSCKKDE